MARNTINKVSICHCLAFLTNLFLPNDFLSANASGAISSGRPSSSCAHDRSSFSGDGSVASFCGSGCIDSGGWMGAIQRHPRRSTVSTKIGLSAESPRASRKRIIALLSPCSKSTKTWGGQRTCRNSSRVMTLPGLLNKCVNARKGRSCSRTLTPFRRNSPARTSASNTPKRMTAGRVCAEELIGIVGGDAEILSSGTLTRKTRFSLKPRCSRSLIMPKRLRACVRPWRFAARNSVSEKAEPQRDWQTERRGVARFFRSPAVRVGLTRLETQICSPATGGRSIGVPTGATLAAAAKRNSGMSKSNRRAR